MPFCSKHFPDTINLLLIIPLLWLWQLTAIQSLYIAQPFQILTYSRELDLSLWYNLFTCLSYKHLSPETDGEEDLLSFSSYKSALASTIYSSGTEQQTATSCFPLHLCYVLMFNYSLSASSCFQFFQHILLLMSLFQFIC